MFLPASSLGNHSRSLSASQGLLWVWDVLPPPKKIICSPESYKQLLWYLICFFLVKNRAKQKITAEIISRTYLANVLTVIILIYLLEKQMSKVWNCTDLFCVIVRWLLGNIKASQNIMKKFCDFNWEVTVVILKLHSFYKVLQVCINSLARQHDDLITPDIRTIRGLYEYTTTCDHLGGVSRKTNRVRLCVL